VSHADYIAKYFEKDAEMIAADKTPTPRTDNLRDELGLQILNGEITQDDALCALTQKCADLERELAAKTREAAQQKEGWENCANLWRAEIVKREQAEREVAEAKASINELTGNLTASDDEFVAIEKDRDHWKSEADRLRELLERMSHWDQFHPPMTGDHGFWKNEISKVLDADALGGGK
jgi:hypothetical protein